MSGTVSSLIKNSMKKNILFRKVTGKTIMRLL